jgi:molybdenum cofactor guanylyltransferase
MRIHGVILAGGTARRLGRQDKALLDLGGRSLVQRVLARIEPQVDAVALSANGPPQRFSDLGLPVLADAGPNGSLGPLSGIHAAMVWAAGCGASHVVSVAVDTPFFPCDLVPRLCLAAEAAPQGLAIAAGGGRDHPTFGLWPVALIADLERYLATAPKARMLGFLDALAAARAMFDDPDAFLNINTADDLERARGMSVNAS